MIENNFLVSASLVDTLFVNAIVSDYENIVNSDIIGISMGYRYQDRLISKWFAMKNGDMLLLNRFLQEVCDSGKRIIGWDLAVLLVCLKRLGIEVKSEIVDVALLWRLIDNSIYVSFEDYARKVGIDLEDFNIIKQRGYFDVDKYNEKCLEAIERLWREGEAKLNSERFCNAFYRYIMPAVCLAADMTYRGVVVDVAHLKKLREEWQDDNDRIVGLLNERYGVSNINFNSSKQIVDLLRRMGIKKVINTDKDTLLELFISGFDDVGLILEYRQNERVLDVFDTLLKSVIQKDGYHVVYSRYKVYQSVTGRWSSSGVNMQNVPKDRLIRSCFKARAGYKLIIADYNQLELRLAAHFSRDKELMDIYKNGEDVHSKTASYLQCDRDVAKAMNYACIYGAGLKTLRSTLMDETRRDISLDKVKDFRTKFFDKYKGLDLLFRKVSSTLKQFGYIESLLLRRRKFDIVSDSDVYRNLNEAVHALISMSASDIMYVVAGELYRYNSANEKKIYPLIQIHDEWVCEVEEDFVDKAVQILRDIMTNVGLYLQLKVPLVVNISVGGDWSVK